MTLPSPTPARLLEAALHADPARVLLTFFDDATGERTELSVTTFANWVAKTANLCRDALGLSAGARVAIGLPTHWQAAVWWQACWSSGFVGVPVRAGHSWPERAGSDQPPCDAAVVALDGEDPAADARAAADRAGEVVGLGLGPMGLPVAGRAVPAAVSLDFDREVHGHADRFAAAGRLSGEIPALHLDGAVLGAGELGALAVATGQRWRLGPGERAMTAAPLVDLPALLVTLLVPLSTGGATLLCRHVDRVDDTALHRRVVTEGVTAVTAEPRFEALDLRRLD